MRTRSFFRLFAGALCAGAAARAASAQSAMQHASSSGVRSSAETSAEVRVLATYNIATRNRDRAMPARVTVSDSAGTLVGKYWLASDSAAHAMGVIIFGDDLVFVGETPRGVLELQFYGANDSIHHGKINGRWSRNAEEGELHGKVRG
jgi:hypothetical protein